MDKLQTISLRFLLSTLQLLRVLLHSSITDVVFVGCSSYESGTN